MERTIPRYLWVHNSLKNQIEATQKLQYVTSGMDSLYSFLESEYHIVIEAATNFISARQSTPEEARRLQIARGTPLLVVRRITHTGGRPVEVAILLILADRYEYCVHTRDRPPGRKI